jgi:hypothetical protein
MPSLLRSSQVNQSSRSSPLQSPLRLLQGFGKYVELLQRPPSRISRFCVLLWIPVGFGLFTSFYLRNPVIDQRYISVARQEKFGVHRRIGNYRRGDNLPDLVQNAFHEGYEIAHIGITCWISLPPVSLQPTIRVLFNALETAFSYIFWQCGQSIRIMACFQFVFGTVYPRIRWLLQPLLLKRNDHWRLYVFC